MWSRVFDGMFEMCEGYRITDVLRVNDKEIIIGKNGNFPKPFATFERRGENPFGKGKYYKDKRGAILDLCKRAEKEIAVETDKEGQRTKKPKEHER